MSNLTDKTPLKNRTAWDHLQTIQRAKEIVNSWPEWKRDRIVFRDKSTSTTSSEAAPLETIALHKRSAARFGRSRIDSGLPTLLQRKRPRSFLNVAFIYAGNDLLSHTLSRAVQSALRGLTSVFGMGTGGSPAVRLPTSRSCQLSAVSSQQHRAGPTFKADGQQT
jgi:hypothetical protein